MLQFVAIAVLVVVGIAGGWILLATNKNADAGIAAKVLAIEEKQQYWEEHRPKSFRYILQRQCFCGSELNKPYLVVEQGEWRTAEYVGPYEIGGSGRRPSKPVWLDDLFVIASAAVQDSINVKMSFNNELGFPDMIHIDPGCMDCDDLYYVSNFEIIE